MMIIVPVPPVWFVVGECCDIKLAEQMIVEPAIPATSSPVLRAR